MARYTWEQALVYAVEYAMELMDDCTDVELPEEGTDDERQLITQLEQALVIVFARFKNPPEGEK